MNRLDKKKLNTRLRKARVRSTISGTSERPRLSVFISNQHVTAQLIDDFSHKTLAYATSVGKKNTESITKKAELIGEEIATKAKKSKIVKVVFDRNGRIYHGRIKALAESARKNGLEF